MGIKEEIVDQVLEEGQIIESAREFRQKKRMELWNSMYLRAAEDGNKFRMCRDLANMAVADFDEVFGFKECCAELEDTQELVSVCKEIRESIDELRNLVHSWRFGETGAVQ